MLSRDSEFNFYFVGQVLNTYFFQTFSSLLLGGTDGSILLYDTQSPNEFDAEGETRVTQVFPNLDRVDSIPTSLIPSISSSSTTSSLKASLCLQWNPVDTGMFITASVDKTLKLWDTNRFEVSLSIFILSLY